MYMYMYTGATPQGHISFTSVWSPLFWTFCFWNWLRSLCSAPIHFVLPLRNQEKHNMLSKIMRIQSTLFNSCSFKVKYICTEVELDVIVVSLVSSQFPEVIKYSKRKWNIHLGTDKLYSTSHPCMMI